METTDRRTCERCGDADNDVAKTPLAPAALFDDSEFWPSATLCARCRGLWANLVAAPADANDGTYRKGPMLQALEKYPAFEVMWLDIPDVERLDRKKMAALLEGSVDAFRKPRLVYWRLGWKVAGEFNAEGIGRKVTRKFLMRPNE